MPELRYKAEVQLMKQSDTPVMSDFLNYSRFAPLVVLQNSIKCIAGLNSCFYLFLYGREGGAELCTVRANRRQCRCGCKGLRPYQKEPSKENVFVEAGGC